MKELVRLRIRPSRDGNAFKYFLDYKDENGKRRQVSLRHADRRKALRQRDQKERELRNGSVGPESMKLCEFLEQNLEATRGQIRENTLREHGFAMEHFIKTIGNIDYQCVKHSHGERFLQACLDKGNNAATAAKKLRHLKRLFQLAVERGQLDENPLKYVFAPSSPRRKIHVYTPDECAQIIKAAKDSQIGSPVRWDLLIILSLVTAMRRGELLNTTWRDIDFGRKCIDVAPKEDTEETWEWHIKDTHRRILPLTDEVITLLLHHQAEQPNGYPYVFIPSVRYKRIELQREQGTWTGRDGLYPLNNFSRDFKRILQRAGIQAGEFHDLRRTCLSNWLRNGMREYEVMALAGHSSFETTHKFYVAISQDLLDRAREASLQTLNPDFVAHLLRTPVSADSEKCPTAVSA
jgi:integrase